MLGALLGHRLDPWLGKPLAGVNPNALTLLGLALSTLAALAFAFARWRWGGALVLAAGACDLLDGASARRGNRQTAFGAFLDSVTDRYVEALVFLGIMAYYLRADSPLYALLSALALAGSLLVSYCRARAESLGASCRVGWLERPERMLILAAGGLLEAMRPCLWALVGLSHLTVVQRVLHVRAYLKEVSVHG